MLGLMGFSAVWFLRPLFNLPLPPFSKGSEPTTLLTPTPAPQVMDLCTESKSARPEALPHPVLAGSCPGP